MQTRTPRKFDSISKETGSKIYDDIQAVINGSIELPPRSKGEQWKKYIQRILTIAAPSFGHREELAVYYEMDEDGQNADTDNQPTPKRRRLQKEGSSFNADMDGFGDLDLPSRSTPIALSTEKERHYRQLIAPVNPGRPASPEVSPDANEGNTEEDHPTPAATRPTPATQQHLQTTIVEVPDHDEVPDPLPVTVQPSQTTLVEVPDHDVTPDQDVAPDDAQAEAPDEIQVEDAAQTYVDGLIETHIEAPVAPIAPEPEVTPGTQALTRSNGIEMLLATMVESVNSNMTRQSDSFESATREIALKQAKINAVNSKAITRNEKHMDMLEERTDNLSTKLKVLDNMTNANSNAIALGSKRLNILATKQQAVNTELANRIKSHHAKFDKQLEKIEENAQEVKEIKKIMELRSKEENRKVLFLKGYKNEDGASVFTTMIRLTPGQSDSQRISGVITEFLRRVTGTQSAVWLSKFKYDLQGKVENSTVKLSFYKESDARELMKIFNEKRTSSPSLLKNIFLEFAKTQAERDAEIKLKKTAKALSRAPYMMNIRIRNRKLHAFEDDGLTEILNIPSLTDDIIDQAWTQKYTEEELLRKTTFETKFKQNSKVVWDRIYPKQIKVNEAYWNTADSATTPDTSVARPEMPEHHVNLYGNLLEL